MTLEEAQVRLKELKDSQKHITDLMMVSYRDQGKSLANITSWRFALVSDGMLWMVDEVDRIFDADIKVVQDIIDGLKESGVSE